MKLLAFSVYDEKVQAFNAPFFQAAIGQASRAFGDLVNDPQTTIHRHPEDYSLYHVGSFDDGEAVFEGVVPPRLVGRGMDFVPSVPSDGQLRGRSSYDLVKEVMS